ncbi:circadian clock KaiB family protein [Chelatococcus sp. GCM10030263]|uniref:circadian clock KaiB family protein n=1 Tax=Chelatococcus sp. GCM10030263 TaxID=3273387 RepID=UPI0036147459
MGEFLLRLYISGDTASSRRAKENLSRLRESTLGSRWTVDVIDVLTAPQRAEEAGILATPTLSYDHPAGPKRIIGDLSDATRILRFLGIEAKEENA